MYRIGPLRIDPAHLTVFANGEPLAAGARVVLTLVILCERAGEVVGKEELLRRVWPGECVDETSLWQNVHLARRILREHTGEAGIDNVRGRGYRLTAQIATDPPASTPGSRWTGFARVALLAASVAALAVAATLPVRPSHPAASAEGLRLNRLGRYYLNLRSPKAVEQASAIFRRETGVDPKSPLGWSGLAECALVLALTFDDAPTGRSMRALAGEAARRAVELDPASAEAQTSYASARALLSGRYGIADEHYRLAIAADPRYAAARLRYGQSLLMRGRVREAVAQLRTAAELEPVSVINNFWLAYALYAAHDPAAAEPYARVALDLGPHDDDVRQLLAEIAQQTGRFAEARALDRSTAGCCPRILRALSAERDAWSGDAARARAELRAIHLGATTPADVYVDVAFAELALHDRDAALRALRHVSLGPMDRSLFAIDPRLDTVRDDPRFARWTRVPAATT